MYTYIYIYPYHIYIYINKYLLYVHIYAYIGLEYVSIPYTYKYIYVLLLEGSYLPSLALPAASNREREPASRVLCSAGLGQPELAIANRQ